MKTINQIIKIELFHQNKHIVIKRNTDWNINITDLAKFFNKNWHDWYKYHKEKIQDFESQSGKKQIIKSTRGRNGLTWITFELAIQVLSI
jgi:hypothetical protein